MLANCTNGRYKRNLLHFAEQNPKPGKAGKDASMSKVVPALLMIAAVVVGVKIANRLPF